MGIKVPKIPSIPSPKLGWSHASRMHNLVVRETGATRPEVGGGHHKGAGVGSKTPGRRHTLASTKS